MIEIDGSFGSGGGQILRTATALAVVTKKPCHIFNIRAKRPRPGLMPQHLLGLQALAYLCNGRLEGDSLGSEEIKFYPGQTYRNQVSVNIPTAGSITLVLQTLIPPALFAPRPIKISFGGGATDTFFSPSIDYFQYVFLKILEMMGGEVEVNIIKRGYYPEGGAKVEVKVFPSRLKNLNLLERGALKKILTISGASNALKNKKVAERQLAGTREILGRLKLPLEEKVEYYSTSCPGSSICIVSQFENTVLGVDGLGKLGKPAEQVGRECALQLLEEEKTKNCLDRYLADQILPYLALANKKSQVSISKLTRHAETNIWITEKFLPVGFKIRDNIIECKKKKF
ncbi:MAG: RNA 3'-terminal phosphate cyclase [Patescibacteria group bacterium]|nr:RNA 3'-terminal phosphate cyclase [Patescibacteria group bacterium]